MRVTGVVAVVAVAMMFVFGGGRVSKDVDVVGLVGVMLLLLPGWGKFFLVLVLWIAGVIVALAILVVPVVVDEAWE